MTSIEINQQVLNSLHIVLLKNLKELKIDFRGSELTAIMGVNGSGKSTILHALACCYKPLETIDRHDWKFYEFFTPNTDAHWQGSNFEMNHSYRTNKKEVKDEIIYYTKNTDRWSPRYERRPARHVAYIGIDTCVPIIEREKKKSFIRYSTTPIVGGVATWVKQKAGAILNRNYSAYNIHKTTKTHYIGVEFEDKQYSALSMGAGEQRVFAILEKIYTAPKYSLILIDEIDLLLHVDAFKKLLEILKSRAVDKKLQIIFTTHSPVIFELSDFINIRHIYQTTTKTLVLNEPTPDIIYNLTGTMNRPLKIFVEDNLAQSIVKKVLEDLNISRFVEIKKFGPAQNCFTLISGKLLDGQCLDNSLFVLDGDVYKTMEEKFEQIKNVLTGNINQYVELRKRAIELITQFRLEEGYKPERYISDLIKNLEGYNEDEIKQVACDIGCVDNDHKYIEDIITRLGEDKLIGLNRIVNLASKSKNWSDYIEPIENWLKLKMPQIATPRVLVNPNLDEVSSL